MANTKVIFTRDLTKSQFERAARRLASEAGVSKSTAESCLLGDFNAARDADRAVSALRNIGARTIGGLVSVPAQFAAFQYRR